MLFHILCFVVSETNVSTYSVSEQQTGVAKLLQLGTESVLSAKGLRPGVGFPDPLSG